MMGVAGLGESLFNAGLEEALLRPRFVRGSVASRLAVLHAFGSAGPRHPMQGTNLVVSDGLPAFVIALAARAGGGKVSDTRRSKG